MPVAKFPAPAKPENVFEHVADFLTRTTGKSNDTIGGMLFGGFIPSVIASGVFHAAYFAAPLGVFVSAALGFGSFVFSSCAILGSKGYRNAFWGEPPIEGWEHTTRPLYRSAIYGVLTTAAALSSFYYMDKYAKDNPPVIKMDQQAIGELKYEEGEKLAGNYYGDILTGTVEAEKPRVERVEIALPGLSAKASADIEVTEASVRFNDIPNKDFWTGKPVPRSTTISLPKREKLLKLHTETPNNGS